MRLYNLISSSLKLNSFFFFKGSAPPRVLPFSPTRPSSDPRDMLLGGPAMRVKIAGGRGGVRALRGVTAQEPPMGPLRPDQTAFLALCKELIETNTTFS